jgi:hypothetical protein
MKKIDILSFDVVKDSEQGFDLALKNADGSDSGVVLVVLGKHSDKVTTWTKKKFNEYQREAEMAKKRGRDVEPKSLEDLEEFNITGALVRVTGWKNVAQDFSEDLLKTALKRNPHWMEQIIEASDDAANFTKSA